MATTTTSVSLDKWRDYFRGANSDIFSIIEGAIMVAVSDCPYDFELKRDRIAEMLFTCKVTKCFGCGRVELAVPGDDGGGKSDDDDKYKSGAEAGGSKDTKESKANSSRDDDDHREVNEMNNANHFSTYYTYGDAEALTDEMDEESQIFEEVLRIKEVIDNSEEESDASLFDSLRRLQLMPLSVETLKASEIGKSVNLLRKHGSKEIRDLVKTLIEDWKIMVDAWVSSAAAFAGAEVTPESVKTSSAVEEEEGLPSPPLDGGVFFATPTSMELSQFFDGMDDDGNPRNNSGEFNKNRDNGRKSRPNGNDIKTPPVAEQRRNQESVLKKPNRPSNAESGPGRPRPPSGESVPRRPKPAVQPKPNNEAKVQPEPDKGTIQKKPNPPQNEKLNRNSEASERVKFEASKRKLLENYQKLENAKKQRTIQVVEFHDLPKQKNHTMKPSNHHRHANGRR